MLALTRRVDEDVHVDCACGRRTTVGVVAIGNRKVLLRFAAPDDVVIERDDCKSHPRKRRPIVAKGA